MLVYVLAHEMAHVICPNIGHTPEFHAIFDQLLEESEQAGSDEAFQEEINQKVDELKSRRDELRNIKKSEAVSPKKRMKKWILR